MRLYTVCQKLGDTQAPSIQKIQQAFDDDYAMGKIQIKDWYNRFKHDRTSVEDRCVTMQEIGYKQKIRAFHFNEEFRKSRVEIARFLEWGRARSHKVPNQERRGPVEHVVCSNPLVICCS